MSKMTYQYHHLNETIAAIATPPGEGGIAIIRVSGQAALQIAQKVFSGDLSSYRSHTAHLGIVFNEERKRIDEALLLVMRAPRSYTGEDTVELHCHGGMLASSKVLETVLKAGARAALPGEFTFKAFMNGKLDLAQAEAVQKMICSKNEQAFLAANRQLSGILSEKIESFQQVLFRIAAIFEAWVDFPEEGIEFASKKEICADLRHLLSEMQKLERTFHDGKKIEQGIGLCIIGAPNAGKSSLMNALLDYNRAIVTPVAGTTRDLLHEELTINGLHFRLTDTAGIREAENLIEKEGIVRSQEALKSADIVLLVLDGTQPIMDTLSLCPLHKTIIVWNKNDLPTFRIVPLPYPYQIAISAKEKRGMEGLRQKIHEHIWDQGAPPRDEMVITTHRHHQALAEACTLLEQLLKDLDGAISPEFLALQARQILTALGRLVGKDITEEILNSIFSQFCIGK